MQLMIIAAILFAVGSVFFALQNNVPVTVTFLLWRFDGSLAMVLLLAVAAGATIIALLTTPSTLRKQWQTARHKRRIAELEKEVAAQRNRIVELERAMPGSAEQAPVEPPYVGLKRLMMSGSDAAGGHDPDGAV